MELVHLQKLVNILDRATVAVPVVLVSAPNENITMMCTSVITLL